MSKKLVETTSYEWIHIWFKFVVLNDLYREYCELRKSNSNIPRTKELEREVHNKGGNLAQFYDDWGDVYEYLDAFDDEEVFIKWMTPKAHLFDVPHNTIKLSVSNDEIDDYVPVYLKKTASLKHMLKAVEELYKQGVERENIIEAPYKIKSNKTLKSDQLEAFKKAFFVYSHSLLVNEATAKPLSAIDIIDIVLDTPSQRLFNWSPKVLREGLSNKWQTKSTLYKSKIAIVEKLIEKGRKHSESSVLGFIDLTF